MNYSYIRVSTGDQADSGLGLQAQREKIKVVCPEIDIEFCDAGKSGSTVNKRPALTELLETVSAGDTLFVSRLCRLSRSVMDFAGLCNVSFKDGWNIVILDPMLDLRTPSGKLTANLLASVAEFERDMISQRTTEALAEKKRQGVRLGRRPEISQDTEELIFELHDSGLSASDIAHNLNFSMVKTARGGRWHHTTVKRVLARR